MRINSKESTSGGLGLFGVLQVIFLVLKLCGLIDWPWVLVFAPLWISIILVLVCMFVLLVVILIDDIRGQK